MQLILENLKQKKTEAATRNFSYAGHPSPVDDVNNDNIALMTLSKLKSYTVHSRCSSCEKIMT